MSSAVETRTRVSDRAAAITARLPKPELDNWAWQLQAACRGTDGSLFFPPDREQEKARSRRIAKAKAVCVRCPVMAQCRSYAMTVGEPFGVWGGLSEDERNHQSTQEVASGAQPTGPMLQAATVQQSAAIQHGVIVSVP